MVWSLIDQFAHQGITFVVGIVLARLLSPQEFGLIGMTTVFIAFSQTFIQSGFAHALIRKKHCTPADYSTVFYFNLVVAALFFLILFFLAGAISVFFDQPQLKPIIRVLATGLIINAFAHIQQTRLTKQLNFRLQARITLFAALIAGTAGVALAYHGFGVWSLVAKTLIGYAFSALLFWFWSKWKPLWSFSKDSFYELFSFGSKLLLIDIMETLYRNIYLLVIGKFFSATELGYFTRADKFKNLPSLNLTRVIQKVSYPVLANIQGDMQRLKTAYQKLIKTTMYIVFPAMFIMAASAEAMIVSLIGVQWLPAVPYLQLLCFVGMFYPLQVINLNMLKVQGHAGLFLKIEVIKKIMVFPVIIAGIIWGIQWMIFCMIVHAVTAFFIDSYYSGRQINYSSFMQLKDIASYFILSLITGFCVFLLPFFLLLAPIWILILQLTFGTLLIITLSALFRIDAYLFLKQIAGEKIKLEKYK